MTISKQGAGREPVLYNREIFMKFRHQLLGLGVAAMAGAFTSPVMADPVADFYKGKTITIVIGIRVCRVCGMGDLRGWRIRQ